MIITVDRCIDSNFKNDRNEETGWELYIRITDPLKVYEHARKREIKKKKNKKQVRLIEFM